MKKNKVNKRSEKSLPILWGVSTSIFTVGFIILFLMMTKLMKKQKEMNTWMNSASVPASVSNSMYQDDELLELLNEAGDVVDK